MNHNLNHDEMKSSARIPVPGQKDQNPKHEQRSAIDSTKPVVKKGESKIPVQRRRIDEQEE